MQPLPLIKVYERADLVKTSNFKYAKFPFEKFNPVQSGFLDVYDKDANFVVASSTSSGKTCIAEIAASYEIRHNKNKVIYLSPLKSLSQEKLDDWVGDHHFSDLNVSICTGDYRITSSRIKELEQANIIIMTSEMLNSISRNSQAEKNQYLKDVGLVVIDEAHGIGSVNSDGNATSLRGAHLESGIIKFSELNNKSKFLLLSATLPNVEEVGRWLNKLTDKSTYLLESYYRPCKLNIHYEQYWEEYSYAENERRKVYLTCQIVKKHPADKFICFVHTKKTGELLFNQLTGLGIECEYHNANLDKNKRIKIENRFREDAKLRVLIATSGLSAGINAPARRVVVVGVHRGLTEVDTHEIIQECVSGNSRILMSNDNCIFKEAQNIKIGDTVKGVLNNNIVNGKVSKIIKSKGKLRHITFSNGTKISVSNHPILNWENKWISSDNLQKGDKVCISTKSDFVSNFTFKNWIYDNLNKIENIYCRIPEESHEIINSFTNKELSKFFNVLPKSVNKIKNNKICKLDSLIKITNNPIKILRSKMGSELNLEKLDYSEIGYLLGIIATDGNIKSNKTHTMFRIALKDKSIIDKCSKILDSCGLSYSIKYDEPRSYWQLCGSNCAFVKLLVLFGITPNKSKTLSIPELSKLDNQFKCNFLAGAIDGDGCVSGNKIRICTASLEFAKQLKDTLFSLNIKSSINVSKTEKMAFNKKIYKLTMYSVGVYKIRDVNQLISIIPSLKIKKIIPLKVKKNTRPLKGDLFYAEVTDIQIDDCESELYNFSIEDCNTFIVEDIVTHNCGRSGRPQYDTEGDAYILLPKKKFEEHKKRLQTPVYIQSQMTNPKILAFHLISEIHHGNIRNLEDIHNWYSKTLASFQKKVLDQEVVDQVLKNLLYSGCIKEKEGEYFTTPVGTVASMFYYNPIDVADLYKNFNILFEKNKADCDNWVSMALANTDTNRMIIVNTAEREEMNEYFQEIQGSKIEKTISSKLPFMPGALKIGYCYLQLFSGSSSVNLGNMMKLLQMDFGRTIEVLNALDTMAGKWNQSQFFKELALRITYGVSIELVELCKIPGIGKAKAKKLYTSGMRELKDITDPAKVIKSLGCSKKIADEIIDEVKALINGEIN